MKILVLNSGSSSVKYELCNIDDEVCLAQGQIEAIGTQGSILSHSQKNNPANGIKTPIVAKDHTVHEPTLLL